MQYIKKLRVPGCVPRHIKKNPSSILALYSISRCIIVSLEHFNGMHTSVDVAISHASNMNNVATLTLGMVFLFCLEMIVECPIS